MGNERAPLKWSARCADGACVEVTEDGGTVMMRDSKDPTGPVLTFSRESWKRFIRAAKDGEFDGR